jgi:hypothetical protein
MLLKVEDGLELQEQTRDLEPLFSCEEAFAHHYGEKKWGQASARPRLARATVSGFWRSSNSGAWLQTGEQRRAFGQIISQFSLRDQVGS